MTKILVIDDEPSILESLNMFLEEKGLKVYTADTGESGLFLLKKKGPRLLFSISVYRIKMVWMCSNP